MKTTIYAEVDASPRIAFNEAENTMENRAKILRANLLAEHCELGLAGQEIARRQIEISLRLQLLGQVLGA
jgi:hypothetical protein